MKISTLKVAMALALATISSIGFAQNVGINSTGAAPAASAMLDVNSTVTGFLVPRMSTAQMNAIVAPAVSLIIYNTTTNCFMFWTGAIWQTIVCVCVSPTPGSITGPAIVGINSINNNYSIAPVPGATGYMWTIVPAGATITAGQGTTAITVSFGPTVQNYTVCVYDSSLTCAKSATSCMTITASNCLHNTVSFSYTGAMQTWTVPGCISQLTVTLTGASGGASNNGAGSCNLGGAGGTVVGTLAVVGGSVLNLFIGGTGANAVSPFNVQTPGGWNGGGLGSYNTGAYAGGGGGGATDIRIGGVALANRVVVAGAGGGGAYNYGCAGQDRGGPGGGLVGSCGFENNALSCGGANNGGGGGGSQVAGGLGGNYSVSYCTAGSGVLGLGGNGCEPTNSGGGGGAGYYGGGAGNWEGGGGGSSYVAGLSVVTTNTQGTNVGNGAITITY